MAREVRVGMGLVDRFVLLLAWIATCGLVYLLGFYVGQGMQERRLGLEERIVRLPVSSQPPAEGRRQKSENEFGFYDKLMGEHGAERAPAPVRPAATPVVAPPVRAATATVALPPTRVAPAPVSPPVPAPASAKAPPPAPARPSVAEKVIPPPAEPAAVTPAAQPLAGGWTVLANPTRSREEADGVLRQLRGRGYDAALVRVVRDGDTWYRVQVGRFATSEQASEVMRRLREHEGVSHVFVASE